MSEVALCSRATRTVSSPRLDLVVHLQLDKLHITNSGQCSRDEFHVLTAGPSYDPDAGGPCVATLLRIRERMPRLRTLMVQYDWALSEFHGFKQRVREFHGEKYSLTCVGVGHYELKSEDITTVAIEFKHVELVVLWSALVGSKQDTHAERQDAAAKVVHVEGLFAEALKELVHYHHNPDAELPEHVYAATLCWPNLAQTFGSWGLQPDFRELTVERRPGGLEEFDHALGHEIARMAQKIHRRRTRLRRETLRHAGQ
ncbi:hypothetical protein LTR08_005837 [Meristemomyces frigidus]|nr:hypothetical protein LTR08_005837 [Meristemomyces frigidus]